MSKKATFSLLLPAVLLAGACILAGCVDTGTIESQSPTAPAHVGNETEFHFSGQGNASADTHLSEGIHLLKFHVKKPAGSYPDDSTVEITTEQDGFFIVGSFTEGAYEAAEDDIWYNWSQIFVITETADTTVEVRQKGDWSLTITPPAMINGVPPQSFTGFGNAATPFFMIPAGEYSCKITMEEGTVIGAHLIRYDGTLLMENDQQVPLAMHELRNENYELQVGNYTSTLPVTIDDSDNYLFNIISDGIWSVTISPA